MERGKSLYGEWVLATEKKGYSNSNPRHVEMGNVQGGTGCVGCVGCVVCVGGKREENGQQPKKGMERFNASDYTEAGKKTIAVMGDRIEVPTKCETCRG